MHLYTQIYEFAASAGAFEGYVYHKKSVNEMDMKALDIWAGHLKEAYDLLPPEVLEVFQEGLDLTLNRAIASLVPLLDKNHTVMVALLSMISEEKACSADDFQKKKWFE